ncbi:MAG: isoleucine--tRNA ligase [Proteobacteria bacterium]|nr:isoleucine--tRNA ligase [Pseudomonadota bacterium]
MTDQTATGYRESLNLPQTDFPMRAGLPQQEPKWIERWSEEQLYTTMRKKAQGRPKFILHCGPPYANGTFHMGHALSYILKDFIVRARFMDGYDAPFVPGWDCHGLPIEWKVEQDLIKAGKKKDDLSKADIIALCRKEADKWFNIQRNDWKRFGVMADLEHPYRTMDFANEAGEVRVLGEMVAKGCVYKGAKSVNWSTVEQTALAEAEIEYKDHTSTAVYVPFEVVGKANEFVVIWTTTPWTLPANRAVAYGKDIAYVKLTAVDGDDAPEYWNKAYVGKSFWVAEELVEPFKEKAGKWFASGEVKKGPSFDGWLCHHPLYKNRHVPMVEGFHVTTDSGTGFVHTAPAHGAEDFEIGKQFNLELKCPVAGNGTYEPFTDEDATEGELRLAGKDIWQTQDEIVAYLRANGRLLKAYKYKHSYPVSWRSKAPLIFRTTPQWFVSLDKTGLREAALKSIDNDVQWIPAYGRNRIYSMIENRPDWCISRQRAWGVPITIFHDSKTGEYLTDPQAFECVAKHIEKHGVEAWDTLSVDDLLAGYNYKGNKADLVKETDILDVWFDSGTTWSHVLGQRQDLMRPSTEKDMPPADMYLEGSDQHRGWFHTSLLTSCALTGHAPYRQVLTHGFVVDGEGRKMSKSLGNGVEPQEIMNKYGADILRLWIAASDYSEDVRLSDTILQTVVDAYRRFRNTFRYLLSNLDDFDVSADMIAHDELPELEKWVLSRLAEEVENARKNYDTYQFHKVYERLYNFCNIELSSLYFDIRKDCLYADGWNTPRRRACQTVQKHLLDALTTLLAPLMPFTTDEVWRSAYGQDAESVHLQPFFAPHADWRNHTLELRFTTALNVREEATKAIEALRSAGDVGSSLEAGVDVGLDAEQAELLADFDWMEFLIVSEAKAAGATKAYKVGHSKCPRCWQFRADIGKHGTHPDVCIRCGDAMEANAAKPQNGAAA